jgi:hypothetical protein
MGVFSIIAILPSTYPVEWVAESKRSAMNIDWGFQTKKK